jgi:hypothetical protein
LERSKEGPNLAVFFTASAAHAKQLQAQVKQLYANVVNSTAAVAVMGRSYHHF